jgi:hypothetical protein
MTDESIDWVDGKGWHELTDREQALLSKVHDEAYAQGFRDGERFGAEEALRASTTLTTAFENRPTQRALAVLERLLAISSAGESERGSLYWSTEEVEAP